VAELKAELERFIKVHNTGIAKPFTWIKPAGHILAAVGRAKQALQN